MQKRQRAEPMKDGMRTEERRGSGGQNADGGAPGGPRTQVNTTDHGELRPSSPGCWKSSGKPCSYRLQPEGGAVTPITKSSLSSALAIAPAAGCWATGT